MFQNGRRIALAGRCDRRYIAARYKLVAWIFDGELMHICTRECLYNTIGTESRVSLPCKLSMRVNQIMQKKHVIARIFNSLVIGCMPCGKNRGKCQVRIR